MKLTVLSVAYPLAPVRPDTPGGAEQVLGMLDRALHEAGHNSIVVASDDSEVCGMLVGTPRMRSGLTEGIRLEAQHQHRMAIARALENWPVDVVHMHGQDFDAYLPDPGPAVIVTLHVPRTWYGHGAFNLSRPNTYFHCVSESQARSWPDDSRFLPVIPNGVPLGQPPQIKRKCGFALAMGRICPEKGFHIALDAAKRAGMPLLLAGTVFRYPPHERYFRTEILPRLREPGPRLLGAIGFRRKRRLLEAARCVLIPSLEPETSSLVAMESLACGTPVIAFPSGALADIVEHGKTGYLVRDEVEMANAIGAASRLDPLECRRASEERFSAERTIAQYLELYHRIASRPVYARA